FPAPSTVSPELQTLIGAEPFPYWNRQPANAAEWKAFVKELVDAAAPALPALREKMGGTSTPGVMAGVPVFTLTPANLPPENAERVLLYFHGGGYVLGPGETGTDEAILMAGIAGFRVISVDYRMAPDHPYPAAIDDAIAVYKELLKTVPAEKIGVFGTSTGGGMTLILGLRAKAEGLPMPGALGAGTPWTDLTKTGDTYLTNEHVDNVLVSYDGWVGQAAKLYAAGHDLKDPMLSPVYGDVSGFPPTMLTSGTRDLFLSNTVRMHYKLRQEGVTADLIVFEGMSHCQYYFLPDAPETRFHFTQLGEFFGRHLE
ncbi:alpha/beta hydrolase, partial [Desulfovibrio sp. 1188_IL3213]|uniref:alpha/beta hydrolase n=2 Tax=unclassified Desulfovibrio TaxID=2593640 RepID=UPI002FD88AD7